VTTVDERMAARRAEVRTDRRQHRLRRTLLVVFVLVVAAVAATVERSWLVALAEVQVEGTQRLDPADVLHAAGLELGTSTLRLPMGAAADRVTALPLVATATIRRISPVRVRISVVERVPVLVARTARGSVLLDAEGIIVAEGSEQGQPILDVLDGVGLPAPGEHTRGAPSLDAGHRVFIGLSGPVRAEVVRLEVRAPHDVDLILAGGIRVRMGRAVEIEAKVRTLGALLQEVAGEDVAVIDVRVPGSPIVSSIPRDI